MYLNPIIAPAIILLLAIPLFFKMIPRNPIFGLRTPATMSSEKKWYSANRIVGAGAVAGASLWLLLIFASAWLGLSIRIVTIIGLALVIASTLVSAYLVD